ncbi:hypothetical protein DSAG12_03645 [Promethearchaeum syntrophicum]|uniref:Uncharacterized protein n=1 Tax=Promethearchaeum syntrophicum TaxID=2594042 RepID=A0A5B9DGM0_9ARCH
MPEENTGQKSISCPECGSKITPELVDLIMHGSNAYCENCGFPFTGIDSKKGDVKPLIKSDSKKQDTAEKKKLSKEEDQWLKWKTEFNRWKNTVKDEFTTQKKKWKAKSKQVVQKNREIIQKQRQKANELTQAQISKIKSPRVHVNIETVSSTDSEGSAKRTVLIEESPKKIADVEHGFNTALDVLIQLSPFYYAFIFIVTIISMITNSWSGVFYALGSIVIEGFVIRYDLKTIIPGEKQNKVDHVGIPMIIVGTFSLHSFGIGVFILARGILHLIQYIQITKHQNPLHPALQDDDFGSTLWKREIYKSIIIVLKPLTLVYFFSAILTNIGNSLSGGSGSLGYLLYVIISGSVIVVMLNIKIFPLIKKDNIENFPEDKAIILIIVGALSLSYGMGVLLLILGIGYIDLRNSVKKLKKPLPTKIDIGKLRFHLVAKGKKGEDSEDVEGFSEQGRKQRKFDPNTGKPLDTITPISAPIQKSPPEQPIKKDEFSFYEKRIFTVLEPDVRRRLLDLQIEEDEKAEVAKSFIYLTYEKQLKYLDELERVNKRFDEDNLVMLRRIYALPISEKQHKFLAKQLDYLPEHNQEEFISFLENTVKSE